MPVWYENPSGMRIRPAPPTFVAIEHGMSYHMLTITRWKNHSVSGCRTDENVLA